MTLRASAGPLAIAPFELIVCDRQCQDGVQLALAEQSSIAGGWRPRGRGACLMTVRAAGVKFQWMRSDRHPLARVVGRGPPQGKWWKVVERAGWR